MHIGTTLLNLRTARGFSQGDIEKRTGLLRCYVSRVENGHTVPSLETLRKWATALDVEMYQLFFEGEGKPLAAVQKEAAEHGPEIRRLIDAYESLGSRDQKFAIALVRKMAKENKPTRQSS